jgi:hypothetical protein
MPLSPHRQASRFRFYHAQKETRSRTAQKPDKDLAYFFSGNYAPPWHVSSPPLFAAV